MWASPSWVGVLVAAGILAGVAVLSWSGRPEDAVLAELPPAPPLGLFVLRGSEERLAGLESRWSVRHRHHDVVELVARPDERPDERLGLELVEYIAGGGTGNM